MKLRSHMVPMQTSGHSGARYGLIALILGLMVVGGGSFAVGRKWNRLPPTGVEAGIIIPSGGMVLPVEELGLESGADDALVMVRNVMDRVPEGFAFFRLIQERGSGNDYVVLRPAPAD